MVVALVDFGNTMADERFMWQNSDRFPTWTRDYGEVVGRFADGWNCGRVGTDVIVDEVSRKLRVRPALVQDHIDELLRGVRFYPAVNNALARRRARGERQAIVTVNPDLFANIAALYRLDERFDAIVTSAEIGSDDKVRICRVACARLRVDPADTVLLDNIGEHVSGWRAVGGAAYLFKDDALFTADVRGKLVPGFEPTDVD
jgi:FMN phosphatase YigB (HAD superfamily)